MDNEQIFFGTFFSLNMNMDSIKRIVPETIKGSYGHRDDFLELNSTSRAKIYFSRAKVYSARGEGVSSVIRLPL